MRWNRDLFSQFFVRNSHMAMALRSTRTLAFPLFGTKLSPQIKQIFRTDHTPAPIEPGLRTLARACFVL